MELLVVIIIIGILAGITFTGASYVFTVQEEKKARGEIEALQMALEQFKNEFGRYPETTDGFSIHQRGSVLFRTLSGFADEFGIPIKDDRNPNFLPPDTFLLSELKAAEVSSYTLSSDDLLKDEKFDKEVFITDPWGQPYQYQYPREDGHNGYSLFSMGPDKESSDFSKTRIEQSDKDMDNIPPSEPGNW